MKLRKFSRSIVVHQIFELRYTRIDERSKGTQNTDAASVRQHGEEEDQDKHANILLELIIALDVMRVLMAQREIIKLSAL